ncbi:MAG: ABC transporter substrate-binding protein [Chlamydiales bacterium]|nr:ABC transporter substrate-binding protein [Chlamydiales bacterium]
MSSKILTATVCLIALVGLFLYKNNFSEKGDGKITVGIIQTASHPALDQLREGFMVELQQLSNHEIDFVIQNGEGSLSQIQSIAANFHGRKKIQAIFAIATPAVQAITRIEKEKPIFIAAVSDPQSLGILQNTNVCGTTDRIDTDAQSSLIKELLPQVRKAAILYHPSESNSVAMVKKMEASLQKQGIDSILLGVHVESEIGMAVNIAARKGDVILVPADNLLVSAMPLVATQALKNKSPLIVSDIPSVAKGALAAKGADYKELGEQTALLAYKVLMEGENPKSVGINDPLDTKTMINQKILETLQITVPEKLIAEIQFIGQETGKLHEEVLDMPSS